MTYETFLKNRLSVCQLSLPDSPFEQDLELVKKSGAGGIGLAEQKLREGEEDNLVETFRKSGLKPTLCIPINISPLPMRPAEIYPGPEDVDERIELMCNSVRRLAKFNPECIVMCTGSAKGYTKEEAWNRTVDGLQKATKLAEELGTKIALEFSRGDVGVDFTFVKDFEESVKLIEAVGSPSFGFLYDFYHIWDLKNIAELTEKYAGHIFGVQYSDWRQPPRCFADRVLPGDGVIDFPALFKALNRGGFNGWFDLEVFSDDGRWGTDLPDSLWKLPREEFLNRAHKQFYEEWKKASK